MFKFDMKWGIPGPLWCKEVGPGNHDISLVREPPKTMMQFQICKKTTGFSRLSVMPVDHLSNLSSDPHHPIIKDSIFQGNIVPQFEKKFSVKNPVQGFHIDLVKIEV